MMQSAHGIAWGRGCCAWSHRCTVRGPIRAILTHCDSVPADRGDVKVDDAPSGPEVIPPDVDMSELFHDGRDNMLAGVQKVHSRWWS